MLGMAILVGSGAGFGAFGFSWLVDSVTDLAFRRGKNLLSFLGPYYVMLIPAMGGLLVGPLVYYTIVLSRARQKASASRT